MDTERVVLTGNVYDGFDVGYVADELRDGDVVLDGMLDANGRENMMGRHTNYGYSGYYRACVIVAGKKKFMNLFDFCPNGENRYDAQGEKEDAYDAVEEIISDSAGKELLLTVPEGRKQRRYCLSN